MTNQTITSPNLQSLTPNYKRLIFNDKPINRLSSSPIIQSLTLNCIRWMTNQTITSPNLQSLTLNYKRLIFNDKPINRLSSPIKESLTLNYKRLIFNDKVIDRLLRTGLPSSCYQMVSFLPRNTSVVFTASLTSGGRSPLPNSCRKRATKSNHSEARWRWTASVAEPDSKSSWLEAARFFISPTNSFQ